MTTWIEFLLALGTLGLLLFVPGYLVARVLGLRGLWAVAVSGPASVTIVVLASTIAPMLGLRWGILPVALLAVVLLALAAVLRLLIWRGRSLGSADARLRPWAIAATVAAPVVILAQVLLMISSPEHISQTFDNIFHLNAVRYILETGNASPFWVSSLTSAESGVAPTFYPAGWHALSALLVELCGVSIPVASNALVIGFAAFVWTTGIVTLTRELWGSRTVTIIAAAAAATCFPAFPILPADYGVLFPYMMALSFVPVSLALLIRAVLGAHRDARERVPWLVALAGLLPAIAISHPGAFVILLAFGTVVLVTALVRRARVVPGRPPGGLWPWASIGAYLVVAGVLWYVLRPPADARTWLPEMTVGQAIGEIATASVDRAPVNLGMALLVVLGLVAVFRQRSTRGWLAFALFLLAAGLYVTVAGVPYLLLRDVLVGAWYNNIPRLAAIMPLVWVPLTALGFTAAWDALIARRRLARPAVATFALAALVVAVFPLPQAMSMRQAVRDARANYALTAKAPLLSTDEWALLDRLDDEVPADAVIVGSPWTGTALAYALADREVLLPHTLMYVSPEMQEILDGLDTAQAGSEVCDLLAERRVSYVLDFGRREVNEGRHHYRGLDRLSTSDAVELVDEEGNARLYRVTACG
ncbi:hypothetical protein K8F61_08000 [Microbacterium resistens]|uniref:4-amino-4-deoxy-L-arabinose transferase n=1 Tax=Microbacterium resistens TaxID=156977 RepID=A0ABY3RZ39_9MICO|nr:DUF6541 family protein [Microbacterium resistens]UGS28091.1 hypothetical protein K8F61_08000 [Microbacterium resistens]